jgi:hypothetical protein
MKEMKNMAYWKRKNGLPGINNDFEKDGSLPDGRSTSSPFQDNKKISGEEIAETRPIDQDLEKTKTVYSDPSKDPVSPVKPKSTATPKD